LGLSDSNLEITESKLKLIAKLRLGQVTGERENGDVFKMKSR